MLFGREFFSRGGLSLVGGDGEPYRWFGDGRPYRVLGRFWGEARSFLGSFWGEARSLVRMGGRDRWLGMRGAIACQVIPSPDDLFLEEGYSSSQDG
jgi:hypothetical protein